MTLFQEIVLFESILALDPIGGTQPAPFSLRRQREKVPASCGGIVNDVGLFPTEV